MNLWTSILVLVTASSLTSAQLNFGIADRISGAFDTVRENIGTGISNGTDSIRENIGSGASNGSSKVKETIGTIGSGVSNASNVIKDAIGIDSDGTNIKRETVFYQEGGRTVEVVYITLNDTQEPEIGDCYIYGDSNITSRIFQLLPTANVTQVSRSEMRTIIDNCTDLLHKRFEADEEVHPTNFLDPIISAIRKAFQMLVIFPGTKWCGAGDVADDFNDLGPAKGTDMCCREHDKCPDNIPALSSKHGLRNSALFTKSNCTCDDKFHRCLLSSENNKTSKAVGVLYFNVIQIQCFKKDHPIEECLESDGNTLLRRQCQEYKLDTSQPMEYQFFDAKRFGNIDQGTNETSSNAEEEMEVVGLDEENSRDEWNSTTSA